MRRVHGRRFPRISQFRHIRELLTPRELRVFRASVLVFLVGIGLLGWEVSAKFRVLEPAVGGQYVEAVVGEPQLMNPLFASINDADMDIVRLVYSGLMRYDHKQRLVPDLAVGYTLSEDQKTYRFELRKDVVWHDGETFDANDVVYTVETIQNTTVSSPLLLAFQGVEVTAPDEHTVQFVLKEPFPLFISSLTTGILPEHVWSEVAPGQMRLSAKNLRPVGTGPFKFKKLIREQTGQIVRVELERFESYYRQAPYITDFVFQYYFQYANPSDGTGGPLQELREQKLDGVHFVPYNLRERVARKHITLYTLQLPQYTALFFNQKQQPILANKELREALAVALDKERIVRESLQNEGQVLYSPILPGFPGYNPEITKTPYSIDQANEALDKKWKRITAEEYRAKRREQLISEWKAVQPVPTPPPTTTTSTPETAATSTEGVVTTTEPATPEPTAPAVELTPEGIPLDVAASIDARLDSELNEAQTFYRVDDKGNVIELSLVTSRTAEYTHTAELVAGQWQDIGIKTVLTFIDPKDVSREVLRKRNYDVLLYGMIVGENPDQYPFWHSSQIEFPGLNLAQYVNRNADELLQKARESANPDEQANLYRQFEALLLADIPAVFLYAPTYTYAMSDDVHGFDVTRIAHPADRLNNVIHWYVKKKYSWKFN